MATPASTDPFYLVKDDIQASVSRLAMCSGGYRLLPMLALRPIVLMGSSQHLVDTTVKADIFHTDRILQSSVSCCFPKKIVLILSSDKQLHQCNAKAKGAHALDICQRLCSWTRLRPSMAGGSLWEPQTQTRSAWGLMWKMNAKA